MPCRDFSDAEIISEAYQNNNRLTEMLCQICRNVDAGHAVLPSNVKLWWEAHQREDKLRQQAEREGLERKQKRKLILSKLSKEDKRILGLSWDAAKENK